MWTKIKRWWRWVNMSPAERYLAEAETLEELERRMKQLSRPRSFWPDVSW